MVNSLTLRSTFNEHATVKQIAIKLLVIFEKHIGEDNKISKESLFYKVFLRKYAADNLKDWLCWEFIKKSMHYCRLNTKCFIVCQQQDKLFYFYVIKDQVDTDIYVDRLNNNIKKMKFMQARAQKALDERWFAQKWVISQLEKLI